MQKNMDHEQTDTGSARSKKTPLLDEVRLLDLIVILVRRRWLIFWGVSIFIVVAYVYVWQLPIMYRSEAVILVSEERNFLKLGGEIASVAQQSYFLDILKSAPVNRIVLERKYAYEEGGQTVNMDLLTYFGAYSVNEGLKALSRATDFQTRGGVISIAVEMVVPELAAEVANAYVEALKDYHLQRQTEKLRFLEERMKELQKELGNAEQALVDYQARNKFLLQEGGESLLQPQQVVEYSRLKRTVETLASLYQTVSNEYEVARVEAQRELAGIEVLSYAEVGANSIDPRRNAIVVGGGLGLFVMIFAAFLLEYIERNRKTAQLETIVGEIKQDIARVKRLLGR